MQGLQAASCSLSEAGEHSSFGLPDRWFACPLMCCLSWLCLPNRHSTDHSTPLDPLSICQASTSAICCMW
jgi:hypothetical protein